MLRHEFLQGFLNRLAWQLGQVIFGGRLPDRLQEAGVLDDDQAHVNNIVLGKPEVNAQLTTYMDLRRNWKRAAVPSWRHMPTGLWSESPRSLN